MTRIALLSLLVLAIGCGTLPGVAAGPAVADTDQRSAGSHVGQTAGRVFIDPDTGRPGPPYPGAARLRLPDELREKLSRSDTGLTPQRLPGGTLLLDLRGRFQNMSVATRGEAGDLHLTCSHSVADIERSLSPAEALLPAQEAQRP